MKRIDTCEWKSFNVCQLFDIHPTKAYKLNNAKLLDGGENPVVVNSAYNNGISGTSSLPTTEPGNMITFSDTVDANTIFYQEKSFIGYPHVQGLYPIGKYADYWTKKRLMFFLTVFKKKALSMGFDYSKKFRREIALGMTIPLPIDSSGNPAWEYMDNYIHGVQIVSRSKVSALTHFANNAKKAVDITKWKRFHLYDNNLFDISMGNKFDKSKMTQKSPKVNFVGRANSCNGVTMRADIVDGVTPYSKGLMTLSLGGEYLGSCFIQNDDFYTSQNVVVLIPKWDMPFEVKQFIATMIFKESRTYYKAFSDELNKHIKTDFSFLLPVAPSGSPDWKFMEEFMQGTFKRAEQTIECLRKI